ncbi:hypothetical protein [Mycobacterium kubicae]|uniref:Uncharacterized protein n=1 Tax=Mycobacterium kubicae TaxID=120959 RepID=A0AAX1J9K9_9MYCO|nr:hypothetical protein [Mycobacterium kubicae]MCV7093870.1 hypothetical protein [Mycobacterium kubicae]QPI38199.1 hypothetical protein I2456_01060 [Mycobacterium kubicae]
MTVVVTVLVVVGFLLSLSEPHPAVKVLRAIAAAIPAAAVTRRATWWWGMSVSLSWVKSMSKKAFTH